MEAKQRMIPYSVHLPEDVYKKLKEAAGERKASGLVRDAITLIVEGNDEFIGGYKKGVRDSMSVVNSNGLCNAISYYANTLAKTLTDELNELLANQHEKEKEMGAKTVGTEKTIAAKSEVSHGRNMDLPFTPD
jgi:hypothetical protein